MAELRLSARAPLDAVVAPSDQQVGRTGTAGVQITLPPCGPQALILAHRGQAGALVDTAALRGLVLPAPGRASVERGLTLIATGPGQWLALGEPGAPDRVEQLFAPLAAACTLVQVDDARTVIHIEGGRARATLAKMLTVDLHPRAFAPGCAAATLAGSIAVVLWQRTEAPAYGLAVPSSFARSVWHWLLDAAAEFAVTVERKGPPPPA